MPFNDPLAKKNSYYQSKRSKKPYDNNDNYQNSIKPNRLDPRTFSIYKLLDAPKVLNIDYITYVQDEYVDEGYIEVFNKFDPYS